ncbi:DUF2865 domain-containing protein [Phyllobacterium salinisoli]|uniref:DUF2865 domain-containing protein n=1 Tax=Phyllobacterium salinisoli TaxID=1899321 RepID=A0A368K9V7_9HYPH|nr:DUF2865 domain-containing protein [Phyllobacterium salinisoli]RCS25283.1 DUF2865 domain-containing protein [Phyllobacterium salinisoli]
MSRFFLTITIASIAISMFAVSTGDGNAASPVCSKLQRQLASLSGRSRGGANSPAVRQLQSQLTHARIGARQAGCTGGLFSRPSNSPQCLSINASINKLTASIAQAKQGGGGGADRQRVLAALSANDCSAPQKRSVGLFTRLFNNERRQQTEEPETTVSPMVRRTRAAIQPKREKERTRAVVREREREREREPVKRRVENVSATNEGAAPVRNYSVKSGFRTLCVRTCDGYYFPISFSTERRFFPRDRNACSAMCPGTDVALYYHDVKNEESEDMVSADTNMPYATLPTAFDYRTATTSPPGCTCQAARQSLPVEGSAFTAQNQPSAPSGAIDKNFTMLGHGGDEQAESDKTSSFIGVPRMRPDPAADPETMLNTEGGLNRDDLQRLTEKDASVLTSSTGTRIRVVGPTFLPDRKEAKGLRAPGQKKDR